jgi:NitT/TauT family transport system ATP-binding protein
VASRNGGEGMTGASSAVIEVNSLEKRYGEFVAIEAISLSVARGEFVSVVGPSGAGKTTLLRCCAGLTPISGGSVRVGGQDVHGNPPEGLMVVFQDYSRSLFPWLNVGANVRLGLIDKHGHAAAQEKAEAALAAVGLEGRSHAHLWELSGGMQQRVAIARALALEPQVLLLDEPFGSVDAQTREELEDLVLQVVADGDMTALMITHDIDEAVYMSDRVFAVTTTPSRIQFEMHVDLPRPRDQVTTKSAPEFIEARAKIRDVMRPAKITSSHS